jgi:DNA-binding response OmpR family regulator
VAARIIIIDDDEEVESLVRQTAPANVEVRRYADASTGLKRAYKKPPSLIILSADIDDGFAACRRLKREKTLQDIGLIMVSASATAEQFEQHAKLSARADLYLHKPLDSAVLTTAYESLLNLDDVGPSAPPLPKPSPAPPATVEYDDTPRKPSDVIEGLRGEVDAMRRERDELRIELSKLTERLHNVKQSQRRTEQGFERELAELREGADGQTDDTARELRRVTHLYTDLLESMDVVLEALQIPFDLVRRHRELSAQDPGDSADGAADEWQGVGVTGDDAEAGAQSTPDEASEEPAIDEMDEESSLGFAPDP